MTGKKREFRNDVFDDTQDESDDSYSNVEELEDPTVIVQTPKEEEKRSNLISSQKKSSTPKSQKGRGKSWKTKIVNYLDDKRFDLARTFESFRFRISELNLPVSRILIFVLVGLALSGSIYGLMLIVSDKKDVGVTVPGQQESDQAENTKAPASISELKKRVKANPKDAETKLMLGHALFAKGRRDIGLRQYSMALELDPTIDDTQLIHNLVASFDSKAQAKVSKLITKHKIVQAAGGLRKFLRHKKRSVRIKALRTLTRLKLVTKDDRVTFYLQDLRKKNCDLRLRAVAKLGNLGDKRAISALKAADKKDKDETPWYQSSCFGDAVDEAIDKIRKKSK